MVKCTQQRLEIGKDKLLVTILETQMAAKRESKTDGTFVAVSAIVGNIRRCVTSIIFNRDRDLQYLLLSLFYGCYLLTRYLPKFDTIQIFKMPLYSAQFQKVKLYSCSTGPFNYCIKQCSIIIFQNFTQNNQFQQVLFICFYQTLICIAEYLMIVIIAGNFFYKLDTS